MVTVNGTIQELGMVLYLHYIATVAVSLAISTLHERDRWTPSQPSLEGISRTWA